MTRETVGVVFFFVALGILFTGALYFLLYKMPKESCLAFGQEVNQPSYFDLSKNQCLLYKNNQWQAYDSVPGAQSDVQSWTPAK